MRWTAELGRSAVPIWATLVAVALLAGCASDRDSSDTAEAPASSGAGSPAPTDAVPLPDGPLDPGRYEFVVSVDCEGVEDDPIACPAGAPAPPPIALEVTVPEGWAHMAGFPVITPTATGTEDAALVLGWTSNTVGVQTDPCLSTSHQLPDVAVGPGVDDFVDAVTAQEWYRGPAPVDTEVGGARGRYFTVRAPADLGRCHEWRPWDPGFFAQGPRNTWEVWVLDVDGHRVVVVTEYFPDTSSDTVAQLTRMVESISFPGV